MQRTVHQSSLWRPEGAGPCAALSLGLTLGLSLAACREKPGAPARPTPALATAVPAAPGAVGAYATVGAAPRGSAYPKSFAEPPAAQVPVDAGAATPIEEPEPMGIPL